MAQFSEVDRVEAAIRNRNAKELAWSLWYCQMRQSIASARPADVRFWAAMEARVSEALAPPAAARHYPAKKKRSSRGLGSLAASTQSSDQPPAPFQQDRGEEM